MSESWHSAYVKTPRTVLGVYQVFAKLMSPFCVTEEGTGDRKASWKKVAFSLDQIGKTLNEAEREEKELSGKGHYLGQQVSDFWLRTLYTKHTEDPKKLLFMWIVSIDVYLIKN